jgi:hypothetical protein
MKYQSGAEIRKGDKVLFHGEPGQIEFVAEKLTGNADIDWHVKEHGPGVMIVEPKAFGRVFIRDTENAEDLILVSRSE